MLSLVAYDSASDSDGDPEEGEAGGGSGNNTEPIGIGQVSGSKSESATTTASSKLKFDSILPKPKYSTSLFTENDPIPPKKLYGDEEAMPKPPSFPNLQKSGRVRITIPSLKDFEKDEEGDKKPRMNMFQKSKTGSGLFAILPQPKLSSFVKPQAVDVDHSPADADNPTSGSVPYQKPRSMPLVPQQTLRPLSPTSTNKRLAQVRAKYMKQEVEIKVVHRGSTEKKVDQPQKVHTEDSDEEDTNTDFFSLDSTTQMQDEEMHMETDRIPSPVFFADRMDTSQVAEPDSLLPSASFANEPNTSKSRRHDDDEDLMKFIQPSKRARREGANVPVNMIDVSADDLRPASTDWLKAISDTSMVAPRKANLPGGLSKRKHQITYLAAEAKAREEELQNQWASNRHAKRQTQSKYGF